MTTEKLRYVSRRRNRNGSIRWYWRRPGFPLVRLPDDRVKRFAMAERLNQQADNTATIEPEAEGTIGWVIGRYRDSKRFTKKAPITRTIYDRWLREFKDMWGSMPPKVLTRRVVVTYAESFQSDSSRSVALAVLYNVLDLARYYGLVENNEAAKLKLPSAEPRQARWEWSDIEAFLGACSDPTVRVAFYLLLYTVQRPVDVVAMRWDAYNGETIKLRQQKTGRLVEVPCHRELRPVLEDAKASRTGLHIVSRENGQPVERRWLTEQFATLRKTCGLEHLQARDLRRTAIVLMGEAGATEAQIAAVSGHSIESTRQILETYLPRTLKMGQEGIRKWEQSQ